MVLEKDIGLRIVVTCPRTHNGGPEFAFHVSHHLMGRQKRRKMKKREQGGNRGKRKREQIGKMEKEGREGGR